MTLNEAKEKLVAVQQKGAAFSHAMGMIYYDGVTGAPKGVADNRAQTLGVLSREMYELATGKDTVEMLEFLDANRDELNRHEKREVWLMRKDTRMMQKIPAEEYVTFQRLLVEADDVWHKAKERSDWKLFEPVLTKIFDYHKKIAAWCDPERPPTTTGSTATRKG